MLPIWFLRRRFGLPDTAIEQAPHNVRSLDNKTARFPDENTVLRFRHLLERHKLIPKFSRWYDILFDNGLVLRTGTLLVVPRRLTKCEASG
ncbi:hypothetical protein WJ58_09820 [Burkholderia ubonensis]|uniref:hypothetical protein n=1 Tax=Burkholderia ubonensis TaxID=101571 RepID=UPI000755661A|nr:hypothetical protein [Burkholderia ubonensis]KVM59099.1 hypothetical protein WJ58_09820 [Burkholderia ubonensis]